MWMQQVSFVHIEQTTFRSIAHHVPLFADHYFPLSLKSIRSSKAFFSFSRGL